MSPLLRGRSPLPSESRNQVIERDVIDRISDKGPKRGVEGDPRLSTAAWTVSR
jgi:hypothetical protein